MPPGSQQCRPATPLQRPARLHGACRLWAREERPRRLDAKARLLYGLHSGAYPPSPMATAFEHVGLSPRSCSSLDTPRSASHFSSSSRSLAGPAAPASTRRIAACAGASRAARSSGGSAGTSCACAGCRACKAARGERSECRSRTQCSSGLKNARGVTSLVYVTYRYTRLSPRLALWARGAGCRLQRRKAKGRRVGTQWDTYLTHITVSTYGV